MDNEQDSERFIEILSHFRCSNCDKWWSIGDAPDNRAVWYCPWCGAKQSFGEKHYG